ncbi:hypothetical protein H5V45_10575 [Nocardioides sp. KIGAM211]|uniref:Uncharacterized protein n=1 Tax=Nocardioides luti TaxID=2761101 RepID=A0A7X0VAW2_9ACTN|nr:hypothetical protein [Nocardioides luti]MBB6627765.1 hypothetical protein [Nocardioides luti]
MITVLGLLLLSSTAVAVVWHSQPGPSRPRRHVRRPAPQPARRIHHLERRPERAHRADLQRLLAAQVPSSVACFVLQRGERDQLPTGLLWAWTYRHGGMLLALALAAGLGREDLEWHLSDAGTLDRGSLALHAELNGYLFRTPSMSDLWRLVPLEATVDRQL